MGASESIENDRKEDAEVFEEKNIKDEGGVEKEGKEVVMDDKSNKTFLGHMGSVSTVVYFPKHKRLVSGSYDGHVRTWDMENGRCLSTLNSMGTFPSRRCRVRNHRINNLVRDCIPWNEDEFICCSDDTCIRKVSVLDGFSKKLIKRARNKVFRLLKMSTSELVFLEYNGSDKKYTSSRVDNSSCLVFLTTQAAKEDEIFKSTKIIRGLSVDRKTKLVKSRVFKNSLYFNCVDQKYPIRLLEYRKNLISKVFIGHETGSPFSIDITINSKNEEILVVGSRNIYLYNTSQPSRYRRNPNIYTSYYRKIDMKFTSQMDTIYSTLFMGPYLLVGNSNGEISLFSDIQSDDEPKVLFDKIRVHEEAIFDMCSINFAEDDPKNSEFVTSSIDSKIKKHKILPYLNSKYHNEKIEERIEIITNNGREEDEVAVDADLEWNLFQVVVEDESILYFREEKLEVESQNYNGISDWMYFERKKVLVVQRSTKEISSFHYIESSKEKNEEEEEGEGEKECSFGKFVESSKIGMPNLIGFEKWDEETFFGVSDSTEVSAYSIYDLNMLKIVIPKVEFIDYNKFIQNRRIPDLIKKINSDLFLFLSDLQARRRFLNICSYSKSCVVKQVDFGYFQLTNFFKRRYCASINHSSSCFYTATNTKGVEMFDFENEEVVSQFGDVLEKFQPVGGIFLSDSMLMISVFLNRCRQENVICQVYDTLYFLDPCYDLYYDKSLKRLENKHERAKKEEEEDEKLQMKCIRKVRIEDRVTNMSLQYISHHDIVYNQVLFIGSTSTIILDIHHPNPVIYMLSAGYGTQRGGRYFPFPLKSEDDDKSTRKSEKSFRLLRICQLHGILSSSFPLFGFNWPFKNHLEEDFDTHSLDKKDAKERASFLTLVLRKEGSGLRIKLIGFELKVFRSFL